jgi:hypothetical protein
VFTRSCKLGCFSDKKCSSIAFNKYFHPFPQNQSALPVTEAHFITKESLQKQYKSYNAAYQFYNNQYGITCRKGWKYLLKAISCIITFILFL